MEDFKLIPLTQGKFAIVDPEDYDRLSRFKWHTNRDGYAKRTAYRDDGTPYTVIMHRVIVDAPKGLCVDHINRNRLDNRKRNLRLCSASQNTLNRVVPQEEKSSRYKGVHWKLSRNKWCAVIGRKNASRKSGYIGVFESEEEAARYHDAAARFYYGEFAITNFPGTEALSIEEIREITRKKARERCSSRFEGVCWHKTSKRWLSYFCVSRKHVRVGYFSTEEEAAIARDQKVKELGIKTRLNFPD